MKNVAMRNLFAVCFIAAISMYGCDLTGLGSSSDDGDSSPTPSTSSTPSSSSTPDPAATPAATGTPVPTATPTPTGTTPPVATATPVPTPIPTPIPGSLIADHTVIHELWDGNIPESAIQQAIDSLHIGYGHTSHGSQIASGMTGLVEFANDGNLGGTAYSQNLFQWGHDDADPGLHLYEGSGYDPGDLDHDCGYSGWDDKTRTFLDSHENPDGTHSFNVIIWSWCGQVGSYDESGLLSHYLNAMADLEEDYPDVTFVYMTGHLSGGGDSLSDSTFRSNEQIRQFCQDNNKWLFDFADIESYSPDGSVNYVHQYATDGCVYDADGDGTAERLWISTGDSTGYYHETIATDGDANWATDWQTAHVQNQDWYDCGAAHSVSINANMKAYAVWWLWCRIAGWNG